MLDPDTLFRTARRNELLGKIENPYREVLRIEKFIDKTHIQHFFLAFGQRHEILVVFDHDVIQNKAVARGIGYFGEKAFERIPIRSPNVVATLQFIRRLQHKSVFRRKSQ